MPSSAPITSPAAVTNRRRSSLIASIPPDSSLDCVAA